VSDPTISGIFDTVAVARPEGPTVNPTDVRIWPSNAAGCAPQMPGIWVGPIGGSARCSSCGGGITTEWTGNGYSTLRERSYCAWCEDPRTVALKAKVSKETP